MDRILQTFRGLKSREVPLGPCHGDLTLANMLVDPENRELCVFDFLDCFVVRNDTTHDLDSKCLQLNRSLHFKILQN